MRTVTGPLQPLDSVGVAAAHPDSVEHEAVSSAAGGWPEIIAPTALAATVFFFNLWKYGFWEPDEARYGEIAREMVQGGSYLVPHLNYVIYVEKPPLLYWLTSLAFGIFGINEFAARFFVTMFGVLGVAVTAWFALRCFGRRHAMLAGAILATIPLYAVMTQVLTTDVMLSVFVTLANFALFMHWRDGGRWCWVAYVAIALGVLTKGPVAVVLPMLAMGGFLLWQRDWRDSIRRFHLIAGAVLIAVISAPWFLAMIARVPGYFDFYFIGEHLRRAFEGSDCCRGRCWYRS
jgi:4-amino-4-deoxy-L-arabinose transferase-like glycosyltransferase